MAGNTVTLEFAGDADKLKRAAQQAQKDVGDVGKAALDAGADFDKAGKESADFADGIGKLGAGVTGMTDAVDSAGAAVQGLADLQDAARQKAQRLARAAFDVADAQENMRQATRDAAVAVNDGARAALDMETALLDQKEAQKEYNKAVKEHGAASDEAKRALIDVKSAGLDYKEAQEDANQAVRDGARASLDAREAQLNLNDAMHEANPPELQKWADQINMITPLLSGIVGIMGLVTAAQWAWNAAQLASPTTWIILGIVALIAVIALLVVKWDWVKQKGAAAWRWIQNAAEKAWNWIKKVPGWIGSAFSKVADYLTRPFRSAFNRIADAWNNTVGALSWTVPGWVPGIGGASISVPNIPKFHSGGVVPGAPGSEMLAILQAGETVTPAGGGAPIVIQSGGTQLDDLLVEILSRAIRRRGGNVQLALGGRNA